MNIKNDDTVRIESRDGIGGFHPNAALRKPADLLVNGTSPSLDTQNMGTFHDSVQTQVRSLWTDAKDEALEDFPMLHWQPMAANTPAEDNSAIKIVRAVTTSSEPGHHRRHTVDVDLHELNVVMLNDSASGKPSSEHRSHRSVSFQPNVPNAAMELSHSKDARLSSGLRSTAGKPPLSPLQTHSPILDKMREKSSDSPSHAADVSPWNRFESPSNKNDVKLELPDLRPTHLETRPGDDDRRSSASAVSTPAKVSVKQPIASVTLNKELLKSTTKSRLVESAAPTKSPRQSTRVDKEEEEEDPFQDIDLQDDKFKRGNLKPITVAQWVALFVMMGCLISSLTVKQFKHKQIWSVELWKWVLLVLVVLCGRLLSGWLIKIVIILAEKNLLLRKKVLYFVYCLRKGVQNVLWLGLALLAWKLMFDSRIERSKNNHKVLVLVIKLLECFVIAAFIWLLKLLLMKSVASSFHVSTFFDRIQESLYQQHVLEVLSNPPLLDLSFESKHRQHLTISLARGAGTKTSQADPAISLQNVQKIKKHDISAGLMKQLMSLMKHPGLGTLVTTIEESVGSGNIEINSELEAKAAGKLIFRNVAQPEARSIEREDLLRFMNPDEIPRVLCLFEGAKDTGKITKKALKNWVVSVYQERTALALSLNDARTAVKGLHRMVNVLVIIIIIVVWLLILEIATTQVLLFATSQLLLLGFIFSNTLKQTFEAIIFLFVMHPFDVGDRCIVDGKQLIVEEMKILTTVFLRPDNEKVFYPNSVLATKVISNLFRSPNMKEFLSFSVHISTPTEKINAFKNGLALYLEKKVEHWAPKFSVVVRELDDLNSMELYVTLQHTINFQNTAERLTRRSELLLEIKRIFISLGVEYRLLPQTVELVYPSTR
ncbi:hypothetical protein KP509_02G100500 [Ceratopteris richardii]|uniref:Mechanosensitive ion channel protein n=1 Tax=Ceratopteris richardii TaxID=49495 RepID=A0A8T2VCQ1_CERRI|nr:hypothetical protein KP509_02G100500 [Ceratopteris richardii]